MTKPQKRKLSKEEMLDAFRQAEASVFLEGYDLLKDVFFLRVKARILSGEITSEEAGTIILEHHKKRAAAQNR